MSTDTQTFETASGQARPAADGPRAVQLPPQLAAQLTKLREARRTLARGWKPQTPDGRDAKKILNNHVLEEVQNTLTLLAEGLMETFTLAADVNARQMQSHEELLAALSRAGVPTGAPLVDGTVSDDQIGALRRAFAALGLAIASVPKEHRDRADKAFTHLFDLFNELLGVDLSPLDDNGDDDPEEDDDADDAEDDAEDDDGFGELRKAMSNLDDEDDTVGEDDDGAPLPILGPEDEDEPPHGDGDGDEPAES